MSSERELSDEDVFRFVDRVKAYCVGNPGAASKLARAAGVSPSGVRNVIAGIARPGKKLVGRVSAVLDGATRETQSTLPAPTRAATIIQLATSKAIASDAECARLREELASAEARVRAAVAALLGGES